MDSRAVFFKKRGGGVRERVRVRERERERERPRPGKPAQLGQSFFFFPSTLGSWVRQKGSPAEKHQPWLSTPGPSPYPRTRSAGPRTNVPDHAPEESVSADDVGRRDAAPCPPYPYGVCVAWRCRSHRQPVPSHQSPHAPLRITLEPVVLGLGLGLGLGQGARKIPPLPGLASGQDWIWPAPDQGRVWLVPEPRP